jgi:anthranilate synthase component 1
MNIRPSIEEVYEYKNQGYKTVPLSCEMVMNYTPIGIIKKIKAISSHCYMLESREDSKQTGRYTFIGYDPKAEVSCINYDVTIVDDMGVRHIHDNPRPYVKQMLDEHKSPKLDYLPTFTGGLVGYFGSIILSIAKKA